MTDTCLCIRNVTFLDLNNYFFMWNKHNNKFMFIVLEVETNKIISPFFNDIQKVSEWMEDYIINLKTDMEKDKIKDVIYNIISTDNEMILIKNVSLTHKGYLYNTYEQKQETMTTLKIIQHTPSFKHNTMYSDLFMNINEEIQKRYLKNMDKDSLQQLLSRINQIVYAKKNWTNKEYLECFNEILQNFKKEPYSSIAKKLQRFGEK